MWSYQYIYRDAWGMSSERKTVSFRGTIAFAKLRDRGYSSLEQSNGSEADMTAGAVSVPDTRPASGEMRLRLFSCPLSRDTIAKVEFLGREDLTAEHIDALIQYLDVARKLLKTSKT